MERFLILFALAALSYLLLYTEGLVKNSRTRFAILGVLLAAFGVRFFLFGIAPNDTASAVESAIAWYRYAGGFWGIRSSTLPYSIPVQYFLAFFSLAPGIYALSQYSFIAPTGIALYVVFALLLVWRISRKSLTADRRRQLTALSLASLCAVALLPWMSADSLYGAEVLLVALCCLEPKVIPAAVCVSFASALSLLKDIYGSAIFLPLGWASLALLAAMVILTLYLLLKKKAAKRAA